MPRYDCSTPHRNRRHHKQMKSGHKGKGCDAKRKMAKRKIAAENSHKPSKKNKKRSEAE